MDAGILIILILFFYFLPTFIAFGAGNPNAIAIFILNLMLGWTFLGWVAALVWSFTSIGNDKDSYPG